MKPWEIPATLQRAKPLHERFLEKFVVDEETGCWVWQAQTARKGYARFRHPSGQLAHRYAYEHYVGPIPDGMTIDHLCRNQGCVNPAHMEAVTATENSLRAHALRTTCPRGHDYDKVHVRSDGRAKRGCSRCEREYFRDRYLRSKAAA